MLSSKKMFFVLFFFFAYGTTQFVYSMDSGDNPKDTVSIDISSAPTTINENIPKLQIIKHLCLCAKYCICGLCSCGIQATKTCCHGCSQCLKFLHQTKNNTAKTLIKIGCFCLPFIALYFWV